MYRFEEEVLDLEKASKIGEKWGFGNLIHFLQRKWADMLAEKYKLDPETAALGAWMDEKDARIYAFEKKLSQRNLMKGE